MRTVLEEEAILKLGHSSDVDAVSTNTTSNTTASGSSTRISNVFNLKLELVQVKRKLARTLEEYESLQDQFNAFNADYEEMKEQFRFLLDRYVGKGRHMNVRVLNTLFELPVACTV